MKNPLWKRLTRELKSDFGKYIVIFLFMTLTIGFVSGFLVADDSMLAAYDEGFEKYNIEHGNFTLSSKATRKPETKPMVSVINRKITIYFPKSLFSSLGRRFHNGFFIAHRLTSPDRQLRLWTH